MLKCRFFNLIYQLRVLRWCSIIVIVVVVCVVAVVVVVVVAVVVVAVVVVEFCGREVSLPTP